MVSAAVQTCATWSVCERNFILVSFFFFFWALLWGSMIHKHIHKQIHHRGPKKNVFLFFFWALLWGSMIHKHIHKQIHHRGPKKNASHGNEVLPQGTTHLIQRPCYKQESPCQDPAGNWTTRRPPDDCKETQTAVVCSCLPFIRSGQNHLARHSERGKKTRRTKGEVGRQH